MSVETVDRLSSLLGGATVVLTILAASAGALAAITGAFAWYFSWKSSQMKDAKNVELSGLVQSMQYPVEFAAQATLKVKNAVRFDPAKHKGGMAYQALLQVGNSKALNARPRGHLFFLYCENVKGWGSADEIGYDLIFQNGGKTELARDLTVDQLLHDSDTALITAFFLLPTNEFEVLGGQITVTVNATKTKHFSIPPQKVEGWDWINASAD